MANIKILYGGKKKAQSYKNTEDQVQSRNDGDHENINPPFHYC